MPLLPAPAVVHAGCSITKPVRGAAVPPGTRPAGELQLGASREVPLTMPAAPAQGSWLRAPSLRFIFIPSFHLHPDKGTAASALASRSQPGMATSPASGCHPGPASEAPVPAIVLAAAVCDITHGSSCCLFNFHRGSWGSGVRGKLCSLCLWDGLTPGVRRVVGGCSNTKGVICGAHPAAMQTARGSEAGSCPVEALPLSVGEELSAGERKTISVLAEVGR